MYKAGKICEYCGEEINVDLRRCTFCGSLVKAGKHSGAWDYFDQPNKACMEGEVCSEDKECQEEEVCQEDGVSNIVTEDLHSQVGSGTAGLISNKKNFSQKEEPEELYEGESFIRNDVIPLSNKLKVFLTVISSIIPGFGQLLGMIAATTFMNSERDPDRRSFGIALLVASLLMFVFVSLLYFVFILIISKVRY